MKNVLSMNFPTHADGLKSAHNICYLLQKAGLNVIDETLKYTKNILSAQWKGLTSNLTAPVDAKIVKKYLRAIGYTPWPYNKEIFVIRPASLPVFVTKTEIVFLGWYTPRWGLLEKWISSKLKSLTDSLQIKVDHDDQLGSMTINVPRSTAEDFIIGMESRGFKRVSKGQWFSVKDDLILDEELGEPGFLVYNLYQPRAEAFDSDRPPRPQSPNVPTTPAPVEVVKKVDPMVEVKVHKDKTLEKLLSKTPPKDVDEASKMYSTVYELGGFSKKPLESDFDYPAITLDPRKNVFLTLDAVSKSLLMSMDITLRRTSQREIAKNYASYIRSVDLLFRKILSLYPNSKYYSPPPSVDSLSTEYSEYEESIYMSIEIRL